jgi:ketosteroid isomerase-like protein
MRQALSILAVVLAVAGVAGAQGSDELREQVRQREIDFARTMADRDHAAFVSFLSDEAIFAGGTVLRGKARVAEAWKRYYEAKDAPFSWAPTRVEVLDSGTLAMTSGPVKEPDGKPAGTFSSVWRREPDGVWRIILDSGCPPCDCEQKMPAPPAAPTAKASP